MQTCKIPVKGFDIFFSVREYPPMDLTAFLERVKVPPGELAEDIGVAPSTIWRITHGKVRPSAETAMAIMEWAETRARRSRLPHRERLSFKGLLGTLDQ